MIRWIIDKIQEWRERRAIQKKLEEDRKKTKFIYP